MINRTELYARASTVTSSSTCEAATASRVDVEPFGVALGERGRDVPVSRQEELWATADDRHVAKKYASSAAM